MSDRCRVWQAAITTFAAAVAAAEPDAFGEALAVAEALTEVLVDAVEVGAEDELDDEGLDAEGLDAEDELDAAGLDDEAQPASSHVVTTISPATVGIGFFISPTIHHVGSATPDDIPELGNVAPRLFGTDTVSGELPHGLSRVVHNPTLAQKGTHVRRLGRSERSSPPDRRAARAALGRPRISPASASS